MADPCEKAKEIDDLKTQSSMILQRMHDGDMRFVKIDAKLGEILLGQVAGREEVKVVASEVSDIKHRIFIDNGEPCIQTTIDRHDQIIRVGVWLTALILMCVGGLIVRDIHALVLTSRDAHAHYEAENG